VDGPEEEAGLMNGLVYVNGPALLSTIVTVAVLVAFVMMCFESWALWNNQEPITGYVRAAVRAYPPAAFSVAVVCGLLLGHLFWR
jgi:hypothetical protein